MYERRKVVEDECENVASVAANNMARGYDLVTLSTPLKLARTTLAFHGMAAPPFSGASLPPALKTHLYVTVVWK